MLQIYLHTTGSLTAGHEDISLPLNPVEFMETCVTVDRLITPGTCFAFAYSINAAH